MSDHSISDLKQLEERLDASLANLKAVVKRRVEKAENLRQISLKAAKELEEQIKELNSIIS